MAAGSGQDGRSCWRWRARCAATLHRVEQNRVPARFTLLISRPHPGRSHILTHTIVTRKPLQALAFLKGVRLVAGVGPPPKDPDRRARRNKDAPALKVVPARPVEQPPLPTVYVDVVDEAGQVRKKRFHWPKVTRSWWRMWAESPLSADYTDTDWSFLMDTALIHARYWLGDVRLGPELRLRVAKFGATPEDRARLRITFAVAEDVEAGGAPGEAAAAPGGARSRARGRALRVVDGA